MDLSNFYADSPSGPLPEYDGETRQIRLHLRNVGTMSFPSGVVGAADPLCVDDQFLRFEAPAGEDGEDPRATVFATLADVSEKQDGSHQRIAYLSLVFSKTEAASVEPAIPVGRDRSELRYGYEFAIPVDAGTVGFFDGDEILALLNAFSEDEQEDIRDSWIDRLYEDDDAPSCQAEKFEYPLGADELAGHGTMAMSSAGWGDGSYPVYRTLDADGKILGYHIDLLVVSDLSEADE